MKRSTKKITAAEKRYITALVYLKHNGVEIDSLTEIHTKQAIKIASGFGVKK